MDYRLGLLWGTSIHGYVICEYIEGGVSSPFCLSKSPTFLNKNIHRRIICCLAGSLQVFIFGEVLSVTIREQTENNWWLLSLKVDLLWGGLCSGTESFNSSAQVQDLLACTHLFCCRVLEQNTDFLAAAVTLTSELPERRKGRSFPSGINELSFMMAEFDFDW